jgi:hypothetical protein
MTIPIGMGTILREVFPGFVEIDVRNVRRIRDAAAPAHRFPRRAMLRASLFASRCRRLTDLGKAASSGKKFEPIALNP